MLCCNLKSGLKFLFNSCTTFFFFFLFQISRVIKHFSKILSSVGHKTRTQDLIFCVFIEQEEHNLLKSKTEKTHSPQNKIAFFCLVIHA